MATLISHTREWAACKRTGEVYVERSESRATVVEHLADGDALVVSGGMRSYSRQSRDGLWRSGEVYTRVYLKCPQTEAGILTAQNVADEYAELRLQERYADLEREMDQRVEADRDTLPKRS